MRINKNSKILLVTLLALAIMFVVYLVIRANISSVVIKLEASNIRNASIINTLEQKEVKQINNDTKDIRLSKFTNYTLNYTGENGYADGSLELYTDESLDKIVINPYLSRDKLNQMLTDNDANNINDVITGINPNINSLYKINKGMLFAYGDIYGTTLTYKGDDYFNTDSQRVVLVKDNGVWKIAGDVGILLNIYTNPDIDPSVLEEINLL